MERARRLVLAAWPRIVAGLIQKAIEGGYQQAKLLIDLCDLKRSDAAERDDRRRQQLCDALLEGFGLSPAQMESEAGAKENTAEAEATTEAVS